VFFCLHCTARSLEKTQLNGPEACMGSVRGPGNYLTGFALCRYHGIFATAPVNDGLLGKRELLEAAARAAK